MQKGDAYLQKGEIALKMGEPCLQKGEYYLQKGEIALQKGEFGVQRLYALEAHSADTNAFHLGLFCAVSFIWSQVVSASATSFITDLLQVFLGRPGLRLPWGFQSRASLAMSLLFRRVWPIHPHFLSKIVCSTGSNRVARHNSSLLILSVQRIRMIRLRHLLTNTCRHCMREGVVFHVSLP